MDAIVDQTYIPQLAAWRVRNVTMTRRAGAGAADTNTHTCVRACVMIETFMATKNSFELQFGGPRPLVAKPRGRPDRNDISRYHGHRMSHLDPVSSDTRSTVLVTGKEDSIASDISRRIGRRVAWLLPAAAGSVPVASVPVALVWKTTDPAVGSCM